MDPKEMSAKLGEPFPQQALKTRQGGRGMALTYVEGHTVIHRLNDATGNQWNFSVDKIERTVIDDANTMMMAYVTLEIPGLGTRSHVGVQAVNARGGEDLVKGCVTDALKKAATLFGVGLELYGPDYEAGELPAGHQLPPRSRSTTQGAMPNGNGQQRPAIQNPDAPISDSQLNYIRGLAKQLGMQVMGPDGEYHTDEVALASLIGIDYDADWPRITKGKASEIIEGMKDQMKRQAAR